MGRSSTAIQGLGWGDEGKGKVTDILAPCHDLVVRYQGGANAGHTVVVAGKKIVLHQVPSGVLHPNVTCVIANGVVLDCTALIAEMQEIKLAGLSLDSLRLSDQAHLVMPWHKVEERILEALAGDGKVGSTGRGIGPCYSDKARRLTALRVGDLLKPQILKAKLTFIVRIKNSLIRSLLRLLPPEARTEINFQSYRVNNLLKELLQFGEILKSYVCKTSHLLNQALKEGKRILFEGANGPLLDLEHGTFPFCTSSTTSAAGIAAGAGVPPRCVRTIIGITKAYSTRVGGGPFPTEQNNWVGLRIRKRGKEFGATTGRPRRCGWLDLFATRYTATLSGIDFVALMHLDVLTGFRKIKVCVGYTLNGVEIEEFPSDPDDVAAVKPVYVTLPGWSEDISSCRDVNQLPQAARDYLHFIQDYLGKPVVLASVGSDRTERIDFWQLTELMAA